MKKYVLLYFFLMFGHEASAQCWSQISASSSFSLGLKTDGTLWAWGLNDVGQLGIGTQADQIVPKQVGQAADWESISAGNSHCFGIKTDGTLWVWGFNLSGCFGDSTSWSSSIPVQVNSDTNWKEASAGLGHSLAIKTDGSLWAWGANEYGQLGIDSLFSVNHPVQVGTATNWKKVSAKNKWTIALKNDHTLWTCGYNYEGQLGLGHHVDKHELTQMGTASDWLTFANGSSASHGLAIKTNGSLWAWGINDFGQLGNNSVFKSESPVQVGSDTDWQQVSTGGAFSLGLKNDGTVWAWGRNASGQLGIYIFADKHLPVPIVGGITNFESVTAGSNHALATTANQDLYAWGANAFGQLGLGNNNNKASATKVSCWKLNVESSASDVLNTFKVYPNPAREWLTIRSAGHQEKVNWNLINSLGQCICSGQYTTNTTFQIPLQETSAGVYFLRISTKNGSAQWVISVE